MSAKFWSDEAKWSESAVSWTGAILAGFGDADSDVNATSTTTLAGFATSTATLAAAATSTMTLAGAATSTPGVSDG